MSSVPIAPPTVEVVGVPLALTDYEGTMDWIDATVAARGRGYLCVAATHLVMLTREDPELRDAVLGSTFTLPDGQPLVWAINALGHSLSARVYGPTLMERYCARAARAGGASLFLYGGRDEDALALLRRRLEERFPGLRIAGGHSPPHRELGEGELQAVAVKIDASGADVVWVGLGAPKQEKWMARMRDRVQAPVLVGVGAAFDFHAGLVEQAPPYLQRWGLEWAYRLSRDPRRLWKRYLKYNPLYLAAFARQYARHRWARAQRDAATDE